MLLDRLGRADQIDWSRACVDSASVRAKKGPQTGKNPTDRGKPGTQRHLVVDRAGLPLHVLLSGANRNDSVYVAALLDGIRPIKRPRGRPRQRPDKVHADKGYAVPRCHAYLRRRGITDRIARLGIESSARLWPLSAGAPHPMRAADAP